MQTLVEVVNAGSGETQLEVIRGVMLEAARCGLWLTLEEIAGRTGFGEASISAQLRHLRKPRYGCHRVEKRHRGAPHQETREAGAEIATCMWEYQVLP